MPVLTTNFSFNKPLVNDPIDEDLWGFQLNDNWENTDTFLKQARDTVSNDQNTNYTVVEDDRNKIILVDASGGPITIDLLPSATGGDGYTVTVKKTDSSTNIVTIDGNLAETIDGQATLDLVAENAGAQLVTDGSNWNVLSSAGLANDASESQKGLVQLATDAEAQAQTPQDRAITPTNLTAISATQADMEAGTPMRFVTADKIQFSKVSAQAWLNYDQVNDIIRDSAGVSSVVDLNSGNFKVNFTDPFANANYIFLTNGWREGSSHYLTALTAWQFNLGFNDKTGSGIELETESGGSGLSVDSGDNNVAFFGELA